MVTKRFQEDNSAILSDSTIYSKESMCLVLNIIASSKWLCWSIDIKSPFLRNKNIELCMLKPPKEADSQNTTLWKLNTTIYRLNDASRSWYLNFEKELIRLDAIICESLIQLYLYGIISQK